MTNERQILHALEGLPPAVVRQVENFIVFLKEQHASKQAPRSGKLLATKQAVAIKKWAGTNLGPGFSGQEHDIVLYGSKS
ncbi:MAG: hypothetical protein HYZ50_03500 [Deltaproteobacteria bacterium]|nr:hypothetical protein [Deltaproteobacteria bacterium]